MNLICVFPLVSNNSSPFLAAENPNMSPTAPSGTNIRPDSSTACTVPILPVPRYSITSPKAANAHKSTSSHDINIFLRMNLLVIFLQNLVQLEKSGDVQQQNQSLIRRLGHPQNITPVYR